MATNMTFIDFVTAVPADWLNNVNTVVNNIGTYPPASQVQSAVTWVNAAPPVANVVSTVNAYARVDHKNVIDFGADNTGATYCDTAVASAIAACATGHVALYFPAGIYKFQNPIAYNFPVAGLVPQSFSVFGAGADNTVLTWGTANAVGIALGFNSPYD